MIAGINESKTLTKHISWECKCKFDTRKCNSNQWWNNNKRRCGCSKDYTWNPSKCCFENGKYLASTMDDSVILHDELIGSYDKETKTVPTNFDEKKVICKTEKFLYFARIFINYYSIIVIFQQLMLFARILSKKKNIYY